MTSQIVSKVQ